MKISAEGAEGCMRIFEPLIIERGWRRSGNGQTFFFLFFFSSGGELDSETKASFVTQNKLHDENVFRTFGKVDWVWLLENRLDTLNFSTRQESMIVSIGKSNVGLNDAKSNATLPLISACCYLLFDLISGPDSVVFMNLLYYLQPKERKNK